MQKPDGGFHNYLSYERTYLDVEGSEDSIGRTLWACGCTLNSSAPKDLQMAAKDIFDQGLPRVWKAVWIRFHAAMLLGLYEYYQAIPSEHLRGCAEKLGDILIQRFQDHAKDEWQWFEPYLTYDNARLPQALFAAYRLVGKQQFLETAEKSIDFLLKVQMINNVFVPIGNDGWYKRGGKRPLYDQQPLEAAATVEAAVDAYSATKNKRYLEAAETAFEWFLGRNSRQVMVYNPQTGGCYDGISQQYVNMNQGAESSISYLLARLKLEEVRQGLWHQKKI
ncbi:MAG: glycosyltransferase [Nitrososphaerota archaeon]|nr:glycosyltransferase [Nitrososphaerota archaeon]